MPDAPAPCILGMDFLLRYDVTLSPARNFLQFGNGKRIALCSNSQSRLLAATIALRGDRTELKPPVDKDYPRPVIGDAPMTPEQQAKAQALLDEYSFCFATRDRPLGCAKGLFARVRPTGQPFKAKLAALSPAQLEVQQKCIDEMLRFNVIQPSESEWASRPSFAPKPDGSIRFCLNFRRLNQTLTKDNYPLPRAPELIETLRGKRYFSSVDAASGYWQIPVHPDDVKYTAAITHSGLFEFIRMPFGLSNAPACYQRMMDKILKHGLRRFCCVYLDDVLIYSNTFDEHMEHVRRCMRWINEAGLLLKAKKCEFFVKEATYLGHIVGNGQIRMTDDKIRKIIDFPVPRNVREVQSFLGVTGYYRKFISDYAAIAAPLNETTAKGVEWDWSPERERAFQTLKKDFNENVPLQMPDYGKPFIIDTDASDFAVGAVLNQVDDEGNERPIFFGSRKLSPAEKKWPVRDKEALVMYNGFIIIVMN